MAGDNDVGTVAVEIVAVNKTQDGFASAAADAKAAGSSIGEGVKGASEQAEQAHGAFGSLTEKVMEYRREEVQAGRQARFFAGELRELGGFSKETASSIAKLGMEFLQGGILGAGIEATKMGVALVMEKFNEARQEAEKFDKSRLDNITGALERTKSALASLNKEFAASLGMNTGRMEAQKEYDKARQALEDFKQEHLDLVKVVDELGVEEARTASKWYNGGIVDAKTLERLEEMQTKFDELRKTLASYDNTLDLQEKTKTRDLQEKGGGGQGSDNARRLAQINQITKQETKAAEERSAEIAAIETKWRRQTDDEIARLYAEADADLAKIGKHNAEARAAVLESLAQQVTEIDKRNLEKQKQARREAVDEEIADWERGIDARNAMEQRAANMRIAAAQKARAEAKKDLAFEQGIAMSVANAWGGAFQRMALGQESASKAMAKALVESVRIAIQALLAQAMAGAVAANASIPIVGLAVGMAAAGAMSGVIEGYLSKVPSAAGGFDVPVGMNPLTQLHEEEMVLPAGIANPLRESLAGGGMGGGITVNVSAIDGPSVKRFVESEHFGRAISEARRNGRL
jgi:hypothetical protein